MSTEYNPIYRSIEEERGRLHKFERVVRELENSGKALKDDAREIKYLNQFLYNPYKLYYRCFSKDSLAYAVLKELIGREPELVYPKFISERDRWYDGDVDRELLGYDFTFLGREEYKYTYKLEAPFEYPDTQRYYLSNTLSKSYMWIRSSVKNFSCSSPVDRGYIAGKGVILYKFYTEELQYFSIINFTGCDYVGMYSNRLWTVGERIQPWASELMNFLVEAWIRRKYEKAQEHIQGGIISGEFRFSKDIDKLLISKVDDWRESFKKSMWIECIMDEIMEIINYKTILNDYDRYRDFVEGIKKGELNLECLKYTPQKYPLKVRV